MSIPKFIQKVAQQDAVYWEFDGMDGYGFPKFKAPRAVKVRWDETSEIISDGRGREYVAKASIISPERFTEQGYLWLGTMGTIPTEDVNGDEMPKNPKDIPGAEEIVKVDKVPLFKSKTFDVFFAYL